MTLDTDAGAFEVSRNDMPQQPEAKRERGPWSIGAGCVVVEQERALLVRNRYGATRGRYLLPAGRVNPGELPDQAAVRETWEETGLRVEVTGLLGVRIWVLESGTHNYFFMFQARLLSPVHELQPNLDEIDDARFFSRNELEALGPEDTWSGALAIVYKALNGEGSVWENNAALAGESGVASTEHWRMWL